MSTWTTERLPITVAPLPGEACQSAFFPAGAAYGPETIEEAEVLLIQWGPHWMTRADHDETYAAMQEVGEFKDGYYVTVGADGKEHRADGRNTVWETFTKRSLAYPVPQYPQPVIMEPEGFEWAPGRTGCLGKGPWPLHRGRRVHRELAVDRGQGRAQLLWVADGQLTTGGVGYDPATVIFSEFGEATELAGTAGAQAVVFGLALPAGVPA